VIQTLEDRVYDLAVDVVELQHVDRAQGRQLAQLKMTCEHLTGAVGDLSQQMRALGLDVREFGVRVDGVDRRLDRMEQTQGAQGQVLDSHTAMLRNHGDVLASAARSGFRSAVYLGSGCRIGSAHEAGLKMLEMTAGRVLTLTESFLGLRHGPMSAVHDHTLIVAFLSSDEVVRAYEVDLLGELDRKELGTRKLIVGSGVPPGLATRPGDVIVECGDGLADEDLVLLDVVVGQLLAFFRCLHEGLRPDSPSAEGVINRVVGSFTIHRRR